MSKLKRMTLMTLLFCLAATTVLAQRPGWTGPIDENERQAQRFEQLQQQLDLSPEQAAEIQDILARTATDHQNQREQDRATRAELDKLMAADPVDEDRLRALMHKQADLRADRMLNRHATRTAVDQVLTPEQQARHHAMQQRQRQEQDRHQRCAEPQGGRRRL